MSNESAVHCSRCGRILKREPFATLGIGRVCRRKLAAETARGGRQESDQDEIIPYDGGDVFIERVATPTLMENGVQLAIVKHTASGIRTNVPRVEYRHSPTGFNFGFGGSGPADFAMNVLLMFCADPADAKKPTLYQPFKFEFCARETEPDKLVISRKDIISYLKGNGVAVKPEPLTVNDLTGQLYAGEHPEHHLPEGKTNDAFQFLKEDSY